MIRRSHAAYQRCVIQRGFPIQKRAKQSMPKPRLNCGKCIPAGYARGTLTSVAARRLRGSGDALRCAGVPTCRLPSCDKENWPWMSSCRQLAEHRGRRRRHTQAPSDGSWNHALVITTGLRSVNTRFTNIHGAAPTVSIPPGFATYMKCAAVSTSPQPQVDDAAAPRRNSGGRAPLRPWACPRNVAPNDE